MTAAGLRERLLELGGFPSYAGCAEGLEACAAYLGERLGRLGCRSVRLDRQHPAPIVEARLDLGAPSTLVVYGMYDVRRPRGRDPRERPAARRVAGRGECLVSPIPLGYKPWLELFLTAVDSMLGSSGGCPNLAFVLEGEEIDGSPHLRTWLEARRASLGAAQGVFWPRSTQAADGRVDQFLGYKGMLGVRLAVSGERWGRGPTAAPVHTQYRVWVDAPAWHLIAALASLVRDDGNTLRLPIFERPPRLTPEDRRRLDGLVGTIDEAALKASLGVRRLVGDLSGPALLERHATAPSVNVELEERPSEGVGLVHERASARLHFRCPPDVGPDDLLGALRQHLEQQGFGDIEVEPLYRVDGARTAPQSAVVRALTAAFAASGVRPRVWPIGGASPPLGIFRTVLGLDFADAGLGTTFKQGGDECFPLGDAARAVEHYRTFLRRFATGGAAA